MQTNDPTQAHSLDLDETRWAAVVARDARRDGDFYYCVETTGVYCRPSCPSRPAKRANVRFCATAAEAEAAGFRPCRRCRPEAPPQQEQDAAKIARACRMIEAAEAPPTLAQLARGAGLSSYHFHRLFSRICGVTPKAYAQAHRRTRLHEELKESRTVTDAIYGSGYHSSARFYATAQDTLGMTASAYRAGAPREAIRFAIGQSSLGAVLVAASTKGVCAISLGDDPEELLRDLQHRFPRATLIGGDESFERYVAAAVGMVERPQSSFDLPLDMRGTAFQQRVWAALRDIPAGATASYADIAKRIGAPKATRAVAGACAANPVSLAVPCHRVVRSDGALSGYYWGVERKRELLKRERKP
ncbi:bifunctional DNA-binding transcriptional regulator/O6-methylguanine-DNA methyltransferase Ada [Methylocystis sp. H62]|uniref:bifunctional DNA-binding transcriptional regulator/O6-methylguanine-DNA methyltransferase Ada n=1 Tax=Methylocystis sp. H62 TaxID=2785789 RepID=UPI0018C2815C|nr:bifunctional DNA-binding transcriptional regulator/O6-methylguanine-DNA methyltransferase Ada [Methylocystis sp. H62]MBG0795324.1 bifunctional DNA-binding transcriptional regulator/O6-methylguanine-DNA methyltransferase Ada [Methylocystis sp. H62]